MNSIYNTLVSFHENPQKNFIKSIDYRSNAFKFIELLKLIDVKKKFTIIDGFSYDSEDIIVSSFKYVKIKFIQDINNDELISLTNEFNEFKFEIEDNNEMSIILK